MGRRDRLRDAIVGVLAFVWRVVTAPVRWPVQAARRVARGARRRLAPVIAWVERAVDVAWRVIVYPVRLPARVWRSMKGLLVASAATKALTLVAVVLAGVAGAGFFYAATATGDVSASSAPVISAVFAWMTNGWGYVIAAVVFGRGTIWGIRRARISRAARATGYSTSTIARLADEIRTTDGTNRAIVFGNDDPATARRHITEAFNGHNDTLSLTDDADDQGDVDEIGDEWTTDSVIDIPADGTDDADDEVEARQPTSAAERFKLWRMDLATSIQTSALVWKLLVPAAVVFVLELVLVQFWVQVWLYPSMLAAALLVGLGVYKTDQVRRRRRLQRLRGEQSGETWDEISLLVKTVETSELTIHMGFLAGRRYAAKDRDALVETLATRALERANGYHPSPSIHERYAWCLDRYLVNFDGWRENKEKPWIYDELVNTVLDSEEGVIPRDVLADRVIEHDRRYIWQGLRFVGLGYDPDLVAECYQDLVPIALVERDLTIQSPDGERDVIGVRARTEPLPPDVAQLRANFSQRFPTKALETRYSLPDATQRDEAIDGFRIPDTENYAPAQS